MHVLGGPVNPTTAATVPSNEVGETGEAPSEAHHRSRRHSQPQTSWSIPGFVIPTLISQRAGGLDEPCARMNAVTLVIGGFLWTLGGRNTERQGAGGRQRALGAAAFTTGRIGRIRARPAAGNDAGKEDRHGKNAGRTYKGIFTHALR